MKQEQKLFELIDRLSYGEMIFLFLIFLFWGMLIFISINNFKKINTLKKHNHNRLKSMNNDKLY